LTEVAIVFAGGMGLGAYQAGAYQQFQHESQADWLTGSSVGAINAALIAGNASDRRIDRLREFWSEPSSWQPSSVGPWLDRYAQNWLSAVQTRLFGAIGHFCPRTPGLPFEDFKSLYDLGPMRRTLERLLDFPRLNSGEMRLTVAATDIETGEPVLFDTAREQLTMDHLMASCGMLPEFAPVMIGGRLLGDGGLSANAPLESVLTDARPRLVFVLDLFSRDGGRPRSLAAAVARKNELIFGNQTIRLLEYWRHAGHAGNGRSRVMYLSYRASADEADAEKMFDISAATVKERWAAGIQDMAEALRQVRSGSLERLITIRR
jgi:NTE family protein